MQNKFNSFYLPVQSICLPSYYSHAGIFPSKYLPNKEEDIQNTFEDYLLLSTKMGTPVTNCAIEIVLTDEERMSLIPANGNKELFFFNKPLPITRVKTIFFNNEDEKEHIVAIINLSSGYIQKDILTVVEKMEIIDISEIKKPDSTHAIDFTNEIKKYNGFLGGFALMKLCGEEYMNYSENYFSSLSFFNTVIESELNKAIHNNAYTKYTNKFHNLFVGSEKFKEISNYLYKKITEQDVIAFAKNQGQKVTKNEYSRVIDYNKLDKESYIIAVLFAYGVGNESKIPKIDSLILSKFKSEIRVEFSELIALCYGINRGYSAFTNSYKSNGTERKLKFELNSKLDYYTIESVYQFSFNHIGKSGEFPYLDWCPKLKLPDKRNSFRILDEVVIEKKRAKIFSEEFWSKFSDSFPKIFEYLLKDSIEKIIKFASQFIAEHFEEIIEIKDEKIINLENENRLIISQIQSKIQEINELTQQNEKLKLVYSMQDFENHSKVEEIEEFITPEKVDTDPNKNAEKEYNILLDRFNKLAKLTEDIKKQSSVTKVRTLIDDFKNNTGK